MKVYYVCTDPITPVVESQVLDNIRLLRKSGINANLILLMQGSHYKKQKAQVSRRYSSESFQLMVRLVPMQNNIIGFYLAFIHLLSIVIFNRSQKIVLHCRGMRATLFANNLKRFFKNIVVIFDCRGDVIAELEFTGQQKKLIKLYKRYESKNITESDFTLFVSNYLRDTISERNPNVKFKSDVIYCTANEDRVKFVKKKREKIRKQLNIRNELVFIYSGSVGKWHCFEQIVRLCEILEGRYRDAIFLILTNQLDAAKEQIYNSRIRNATAILSVEPEEVGDYLCASDVAMIIRESHPLNYSASPVKVAEFIVNGLPLIISESIRDYAKLVAKTNCGVVLGAGPITASKMEGPLMGFSESDWLNLRNTYPEDTTKVLTKTSAVKKLSHIYEMIC